MPRPINSRVINWYRTPISQEQIAELNQRSDLKGLLQSLGFLSLLVLTGTSTFLAWYHGYWGLMLMGFFFHATVMHFSINAIHELVHETVFETEWLNKFFADTFSIISWIDHQVFWASHTEHHKYTLFYPDDGEVVAPVRINPQLTHILKRGFINLNFYKAIFLHLRYTIRVAWGKGFPSDDWHQKLFPETYQEGRDAFFRRKRTQLVVHGTVFVVSLLTGMWIIPFIFSFSQFFGGSWLQNLCNQTQHAGLSEDIPDFRMSCRTITLSPFVQFLYWHMNFHIEHHMFAGVPCYNLKKCHDLIKDDCPKATNGLVETWVNLITVQRKMDLDANYRFIPELPSSANPPRMKEEEPQEPILDVDGITPLDEPSKPEGEPYKIWECQVCAFVYHEAKGIPEEGIPAGTRWEDVPEDWRCPDCKVPKSKFKMVEVATAP